MKYLRNRTFAKIMSVLIAILMWMYVVSVENPQTEVAFRYIPITVLNESKLNDRGLSLIEMSETTLSVRVEGRRSDVGAFSTKDITATVDVSDIKLSGKYMMDVSISTNVEGISLKRTDIKKTEVYVDAIRAINQTVNVKTEGLPKTSYVLGEKNASVTNIVIKGPSGVVNKIAEASVAIDVSGADAKITKVCPVKLYDLSGTEIEKKYLSLSQEDVTVNIDVLKEQKLDIIPIYTQEYDLSGYEIKINPENVTVLTNTDYTGAINTKPLTLHELERGATFTKKVSLEIPDNVKLMEQIGTVTIEFKKK